MFEMDTNFLVLCWFVLLCSCFRFPSNFCFVLWFVLIGLVKVQVEAGKSQLSMVTRHKLVFSILSVFVP